MKPRVLFLLAGILAAAGTSAVHANTASAYDAGQAALKAGQYASAVRDFRAAVDHRQHLPDAYVGLGTAYVGLGRFANAFQAYRQAAGVEPKNADVLYKTAYAALYSDDYHNAVSYGSRYIALRPNDPKGYHLRFLAYGGLLDAKHQLADARQVSKLEPNNPSALNDLGIGLVQNKQYSAAEKVLGRAIALQPGNWQFYKNRGLAEYQNHQFPLALKDFQRAEALTKDPVQRSNLKAAIAFLQKQMHH
jgi:Flp pilus assembly protein TadD